MAAATAAQVKSALASMLKISEYELPDYYVAVTPQAATFGRQEVYGRLLKRGFVTGEIDGFDRLNEFSLDLGLWKAIHLAGLYGQFDPVAVSALDRRAELGEVLVTVAGVWVQPRGAARPATATTAGPAANGGGVFDFDPGDDSGNLGIDW